MAKRAAGGAGLKAAQRATKAKKKGIRVILEGGPVRSKIPIIRSDLAPGTPEITLPYWWETLTYTLDRIDEAGVHCYRYSGTVISDNGLKER